MKIKIDYTKNTASNPLTSLCPVGSKFSAAKNKYGNLCIFHKGIPTSKSYMNAGVLRELLIQNKEFFKNELGVVIKDKHEKYADAIDQPIDDVSATQKKAVETKDLSYDELKKKAKELKIDFKGNIKKSDLISLIEKQEG